MHICITADRSYIETVILAGRGMIKTDAAVICSQADSQETTSTLNSNSALKPPKLFPWATHQDYYFGSAMTLALLMARLEGNL